MLIRFAVSNLFSFDQEVEFNMLPATLKTHKNHIYSLGKIDVLKGAAIYGANGAGKSNLINAIDYLKELVTEGYVSHSVNSIKFKLNKESQGKPVCLEIEFEKDKTVYYYVLNIDDTTIIEESLYESGVTKDDKLIFERKTLKSRKVSIKMAPAFQKTQKSKLLISLMEDNLLKPNELFISKHDTLKIKPISSAYKWITDYLLVIYPNMRFGGLVNLVTRESKIASFFDTILSSFDTGVKGLRIEKIDFETFFGDDDEVTKNEIIEKLKTEVSVNYQTSSGQHVVITKEGKKIIVKRIVSVHLDNNGNEILFDLQLESDGTKRLLDFLPAFYYFLGLPVTIIIDEIDQSLHAALLQTLLKKIMSDDTSEGQLIFTTHESNLLDLDIFRQDEIWFAEKNRDTNATSIYSLSEFKPRYDLDIRKGYLKGRFGAVPFLANLNNLNWHTEPVENA